jgi:WD40 repeat protein
MPLCLDWPGRVDHCWWDPVKKEVERAENWSIPHPANSTAMFLGDQLWLAAGANSGLLTICKPGKRNLKIVLPRRKALARVTFSPDGRTLAILRERTLRLYDVKSRQVDVSWTEGRTIHALAFSPDSRILATAGHDGSVKFRDTATGKERANFDWQIGSVTAVAFSPAGMLAAAGGENGRVVVWDVDQV